jgi:hypothetical protein
MKTIINILFFLSSSIIFSQAMVMPQVPQGVTYQAIALNNAGNQLINSNIKLRLSIIDNSATGTVLYTETHAKTTNDKGLYSLVIGQGTIVTGTFSSIDWGKNVKFLKVEMDATGGTNYTIVGSTQMQSVPYALYSGKTASIAGNTSINDEIVENKSGNFAFASDNGVVYAYNAKLNEWSSQIGRPDNVQLFYQTSIVASNENFGFASDNGVIYIYNAKLNSWTSQIGRLLSFGSLGIVYMEGSNGNFAFASDNGVVYVYNAKLNSWSSQIGRLEYIGYVSGKIVGSKGNFAFASDNGVVYVYNAKLNSWSSQIGSLNNNDNGIQSFDGNGNFSFPSSNGVVYVYNERSNSWSSQIGSLTSGTKIVASPSN